MYDTIHAGDRHVQVKCFDRALRDYVIGDEVPTGPGTGDDFQIDAWGHGWVHIRGGRIVAWTDEPADDLTKVDTAGVAHGQRHPRHLPVDPHDCHVCARLRGETVIDIDLTDPVNDSGFTDWLRGDNPT